jgi:hypothetical protein
MMVPRGLRWLVCVVLVSAVVGGSSAGAGELLNRLVAPSHPAPTPHNSINRYAAVPPGHQRYFAYNVEEYPRLNHGLGIPTYNWGYFGAHFRPITSVQHRYHDGAWQGCFQPAD